MKRNNYLWLVLLLLSITIVQAQEKLITGFVSNETDSPLNGVNIFIKDTAIGTQTDFDGNYNINVSVGQTLVYSFVGFEVIELII